MADELVTLTESNDTAGKWLEGFFKNEKPTDKDFKKARIATSHRATLVRAHSAITARERVKFSIARDITEDKEQLAEYLKASLPNGQK